MEVILFIYGFSFLALGVVVVTCLGKEQLLGLNAVFRWLAAFAFVHGALEWLELWRVVRGDTPAFAAIRAVVLLVSYLLLFEFGRRLTRGSPSRERPARIAGLLLDARMHLLLVGGVAVASALSDNLLLNLTVWSRYLVGTSASVLAGIGFLRYARHHGASASEGNFPYRSSVFRLAGISFLLYGVFGGLVVPRTDWAPAAWLNQESFEATLQLPVQLFRAACATLIAFALGSIFFSTARLKVKIWLLTSAVVGVTVAVDMVVGFNSIEHTIRNELTRDAKDIRAMLMATRRVYHQQFIGSGLPVNDQTIGFLPAHAMSRISRDFPNWSKSGLSFNNVSDQPRNPANRADAFELEAMAFFRAHPKAEERLAEIKDSSGASLYHYTAPIWIEPYCLQCHGAREKAPASVASTYDSAYGYQLGDLRGVMSIKLPVTPMRDRAYREWLLQFAMRFVGYTLLALVLVAFLNRAVISRLGRLREATGHLAAGDYAARSPVVGSDEVSELSHAFNAMGDEIQARDGQIRRLSGERLQAIEELQRHRDRLEDIVAERTADLREYSTQLETANADLESFSYSVSHDLRAPLRALDGYARILHEDEAGKLSAEGRAMLERIWINSNRMGALIDDILQFSRVGRAELKREAMDMTASARSVAEEMRGDYPAAQIAVAEMPLAAGDQAMLRQVWVNLIGNALKFSSKRPQPEIAIGSEIREGETVFYVRDNGVGFDMAHAAKLFGVFQRLHAESEFPGTGAGLAIVKRIVERHGGQAWAEAQPDVGAVVYFTLGSESIIA